ncbi:MAG: hypothetical protein ACOCTI_03440 [Phycisphaeraceae bacterium]
MEPTRKTLLLAAVHSELEPARERLGLTREAGRGLWAGSERPMLALATGMGPERMKARLGEVLEREPVERVVLLGFAGGLDPALKAGEVVRFSQVVSEAGERLDLAGPGAGAVLLSADRLAESVDRKRGLRQRYEAEAVDLETFDVAAMLRERGIELAVLRAISDPFCTALPAEAMDWVRPDGEPDPWAAAKWVAQHPLQLPDLLRLAWVTRRGAKALGREVAKEVAR